MKHLKKFNESSSSLLDSIDREYVEMCFINLIDSERFRQIQMWKYDTYMDISFNLPFPAGSNITYSPDIKPFINCGATAHQLYLDVEDCINKVKIEYPNYKIEYKQFTTGFIPNVFVIRITI